MIAEASANGAFQPGRGISAPSADEGIQRPLKCWPSPPPTVEPSPVASLETPPATVACGRSDVVRALSPAWFCRPPPIVPKSSVTRSGLSSVPPPEITAPLAPPVTPFAPSPPMRFGLAGSGSIRSARASSTPGFNGVLSMVPRKSCAGSGSRCRTASSSASLPPAGTSRGRLDRRRGSRSRAGTCRPAALQDPEVERTGRCPSPSATLARPWPSSPPHVELPRLTDPLDELSGSPPRASLWVRTAWNPSLDVVDGAVSELRRPNAVGGRLARATPIETRGTADPIAMAPMRRVQMPMGPTSWIATSARSPRRRCRRHV